MPFPTNPQNAEVHEGYIYNASLNAWDYLRYNEVPTSGLVSYIGTIIGSPAVTEGPDGVMSALTFDGDSDYIDTNLRPGSYSVSVWSKDNTSRGMVYGSQDSGGGRAYFGVEDGYYRIGIGTKTWSGPPNIIAADGNWHHFVIIWNNAETSASIYVDGLFSHTESSSGGFSNYSWFLGANNDANEENVFFSGAIAGHRIYNRELSVEEIDILYRYGLFGNQKYVR